MVLVDVLSGGTASADNEYNNTNYALVNACDNDEASMWFTATGGPHWWKYDLGAGQGKVVTSVRVKPGPLSGYSYTGLRHFVLKGSNDNSNWTTIYSGEHANNLYSATFSFSNSNAYRYYMIDGLDSYSPDGTYLVGVQELEFLAVLTTRIVREALLDF